MNILICAKINPSHIQKIKETCPFATYIYKDRHELTQSDIDDSDVIIGNPPLNLNLNTSRLIALMLNSAGNEHYIKEGVLNPHTLLTNASGAYGPTIAEHALGMLIALNKNFPLYIHQQEKGIWQPSELGKELYQSIVAIVGYGDIGQAFAKRVKAFDTRVIAFKKHMNMTSQYVDALYPITAINDHIDEADYVFLSLPETKETIHLFDEKMFAMMKKGAMIINVGRGSAIDTHALIQALNNHHLYGAALDVVEEEPLPQDHPLYTMDNVLITPHASGGYHWESVKDYYTDLVIRNLKHLKNDEPLENLVDRTLGYRAHVVYREKENHS